MTTAHPIGTATASATATTIPIHAASIPKRKRSTWNARERDHESDAERRDGEDEPGEQRSPPPEMRPAAEGGVESVSEDRERDEARREEGQDHFAFHLTRLRSLVRGRSACPVTTLGAREAHWQGTDGPIPGDGRVHLHNGRRQYGDGRRAMVNGRRNLHDRRHTPDGPFGPCAAPSMARRRAVGGAPTRAPSCCGLPPWPPRAFTCPGGIAAGARRIRPQAGSSHGDRDRRGCGRRRR